MQYLPKNFKKFFPPSYIRPPFATFADTFAQQQRVDAIAHEKLRRLRRLRKFSALNLLNLLNFLN
jgi:hypothetical protein